MNTQPSFMNRCVDVNVRVDSGLQFTCLHLYSTAMPAASLNIYLCVHGGMNRRIEGDNWNSFCLRIHIVLVSRNIPGEKIKT